MATAEHSFPRYYKLGAGESQQPGDFKCLTNSQQDIGSSRYDTLETPRGTDYQVPTGKTFWITKVIGGTTDGAAGVAGVAIGYGNSGVANSVAAPTNSFVMAEIDHRFGGELLVNIDVLIPIPAGNYPWVQSRNAASNWTIFGMEV